MSVKNFKSEYTCDICDFKTYDETQVNSAKISVGETYIVTDYFHICNTCYESPKDVLQKIFNKTFRKK